MNQKHQTKTQSFTRKRYAKEQKQGNLKHKSGNFRMLFKNLNESISVAYTKEKKHYIYKQINKKKQKN